MRVILSILLAIFCMTACQSKAKQKRGEEDKRPIKWKVEPEKEARRKRKLAKKDSIIRAKLILKQIKRRKDSIDIVTYFNASDAEILKFLRVNSKYQNTSFCSFPKNHIDGSSIRDLVEIPKPIYEGILPKIMPIEGNDKNAIDIQWRKERIAAPAWLYGLNEKSKHIQLIIAVDGKYTPQLTLFTLSKPHLKLMEEMVIHFSFADAGEIDITLACLKTDFEKLTIWSIYNSTTKSDWELADTLETQYEILEDGRIEKILEGNLFKDLPIE